MTILFLHIPKTAGSFLDSQVKESTCNSKHAISSEQAIDAVINEQLDYIAGHFVYDNIEKHLNTQNYRLVSLVRNPIDRFFSEANYHIEILARGEEFFRKHGGGAQKLILKTYNCIHHERSKKERANLEHLYNFSLIDYLAKRILSTSLQNALKLKTPNYCSNKIRLILKQYSFIDTMEDNGVDKLVDFISTNSPIKLDAASKAIAFKNKSMNYIDPSFHLATIASILRSNCSVSNLLHLIISGIDSDFIKDKSWEFVNEYSCAKFISESKYLKTVSFDTLPRINWLS